MGVRTSGRYVVGVMLALAAGVAIGGCESGGPGAAAEPDPTTLKGKPADDFALKTLDGKELKLSGQKGKVVVVDTWATWCGPCRESLPHLQKISADANLAGKGLVVWAVDDKEKSDDVTKFLKDNKYTFTVLMDTEAAVLKKYLVSGIPTTFIIGRDGTIKDVFVGYGGDDSAKDIDTAVDKALAEPAPK